MRPRSAAARAMSPGSPGRRGLLCRAFHSPPRPTAEATEGTPTDGVASVRPCAPDGCFAAARNAANACSETRNFFRDAILVPTGFALLARDMPSVALAARASEALCKHFRALAAEPEEKWTAHMLSPVPRQVRGVPGLGGTGVMVALR